MRGSVGHLLLRLLGGLCATAGVLAWIRVAWTATSNLDDLTLESGVGERLLVLGLTGTVLMIVGAVLLHVAAAAPEHGGHEEPAPPR
jgi:hypothetical protein